MNPISQRGTVATGIASAGVAGAATNIIIWIVGLLHITVPSDVAADFMVLATAALHWAAHRYGVAKAIDSIVSPTAEPATPPSK